MYTHTHTYIHKHSHTHTYISIHTHTIIYIYIYIYIYIFIYLHTHAYFTYIHTTPLQQSDFVKYVLCHKVLLMVNKVQQNLLTISKPKEISRVFLSFD